MTEENLMNIKPLNTMDQLFCSPDGRSWNLQGSDVNITDRHNIISVPVRRYTNINDEYTILACTNMSPPIKIYYQLAVKRPMDVGFSATPDKDARILKRLLERAPISVGHYIEIEQKLLRKFADMRRREFLEKMKVKYYGAQINGNTLAETEECERNNMEVVLRAQHQEIVKYHSSSPRLVVSDEDIKIIKLLLQVAKQHINTEETLLEHEGMLMTRPQGIKKLAHLVDFFIKVQIPGPPRIPQLIMSTTVFQCTGPRTEISHRMNITDVQDENSFTRMSDTLKDYTPILDGKGYAPTIIEMNDQKVMKTLLNGYYDAKDKKIVLADDDDGKCKKIVLDGDDDEKCKKIVIDDDDDEGCFGIMGVYCNSSIHAAYKDVVINAEKAIG